MVVPPNVAVVKSSCAKAGCASATAPSRVAATTNNGLGMKGPQNRISKTCGYDTRGMPYRGPISNAHNTILPLRGRKATARISPLSALAQEISVSYTHLRAHETRHE